MWNCLKKQNDAGGTDPKGKHITSNMAHEGQHKNETKHTRLVGKHHGKKRFKGITNKTHTSRKTKKQTVKQDVRGRIKMA